MVDLGQKKVNACLPFFISLKALSSEHFFMVFHKKTTRRWFKIMRANCHFLFVGFKAFCHFIPIDNIEKCSHIVGPSILIIQVIGVFPHINSKYGVPPHPTPGIKGLSWFGVAHTSNFPPLCTQSQAQPEPNWVLAAFEKRSLKASKLPNDSLMAVAKAAEGAPPPFGDITSQKRLWL